MLMFYFIHKDLLKQVDRTFLMSVERVEFIEPEGFSDKLVDERGRPIPYKLFFLFPSSMTFVSLFVNCSAAFTPILFIRKFMAATSRITAKFRPGRTGKVIFVISVSIIFIFSSSKPR